MPIPRRSLLLAGAAAGLLTACGGGDDDHAPPNIVATAQATPNLSILVEAVVAAGLVDALSAPGPLTVFAPTNAAFAALLAELGVTKEALLADKTRAIRSPRAGKTGWPAPVGAGCSLSLPTMTVWRAKSMPRMITAYPLY